MSCCKLTTKIGTGSTSIPICLTVPSFLMKHSRLNSNSDVYIVPRSRMYWLISFFHIISECQSQIIKALRRKGELPDNTTKDLKLDLVFATIDNFYSSDIFTCEDKPIKATTSKVGKDETKNDNLRVQTLRCWQMLLDNPNDIEYLEAKSGQSHGLQLKVSGTRMLADGPTVHYNKAHVDISGFPLPTLAKFIRTIISLQVRRKDIRFILLLTVYYRKRRFFWTSKSWNIMQRLPERFCLFSEHFGRKQQADIVQEGYP